MKRIRYERIDTARGIVILSMVLFHGIWDLLYFCGWDLPWFTGWPGQLWQQSIAWSFILISGFCASLGQIRWRRPAELLCWSAAITAGTMFFGEGDLICFGVLSLIGSSMVAVRAGRRLWERVSPAWGLAMFSALFLLTWRVPYGGIGLASWQYPLPAELYQYWAGAYIGLRPADFHSLDYFPLLPWLFLYLAGYMGGRWFQGGGRLILLRGRRGRIGWIGRHSLAVYLLHQPVWIGLLLLIENIERWK